MLRSLIESRIVALISEWPDYQWPDYQPNLKRKPQSSWRWSSLRGYLNVISPGSENIALCNIVWCNFTEHEIMHIFELVVRGWTRQG